MREKEETQRVTPRTAPNQAFEAQRTYQAPADAAPPLISKKWLACRFNLMSPAGSVDYKGLYRKVLTPYVIQEMGLTIEQVRRSDVRTFDRQQTIKLIEILSL